MGTLESREKHCSEHGYTRRPASGERRRSVLEERLHRLLKEGIGHKSGWTLFLAAAELLLNAADLVIEVPGTKPIVRYVLHFL